MSVECIFDYANNACENWCLDESMICKGIVCGGYYFVL